MKTTTNTPKLIAAILMLLMLPFCEMKGSSTPVALFNSSAKTMTFDCMSDSEIAYYKKQTGYSIWSGEDIIDDARDGYGLVGDKVLKAIIKPNFNEFAPQDFDGMFENFENMTSIEGLENLNFTNCISLSLMFSHCRSLTAIDLSHFDTRNVSSMSYMFWECNSLKSIDASYLKTGNVTSVTYLFYNCTSLEEIKYLWTLDTSNMYAMGGMFKGCESLTELDVGGFDTSKCTDMSSMFESCRNVSSIDVSKFVTSNVKRMSNMFSCCSKMESVDLSNFDTSKVEDMTGMFNGCNSLRTLDVSMFDVSKVTIFNCMFRYSPNLTTIYCNDTWPADVESKEMFLGCKALKGAISYSQYKVDAAFANPDNGYFTRVESYGLDIAGVPVTNVNCHDLTGIPGVYTIGGHLSYDPLTKTLEIDEADIIGGEYPAISNSIEDLTIKVGKARMLGSNQLTTSSGVAALKILAPTTIKGNPQLTMLKNDGCLFVTGGTEAAIYLPKTDSELTIDDAVVNANGGSRMGIGGRMFQYGVDKVEFYGILRVKGVSHVGAIGSFGSIRDLKYIALPDHCAIVYPEKADFTTVIYESVSGLIPIFSGVCVGKELVSDEPVYISYNNTGDVNVDGDVNISDVVAEINTMAGDNTFWLTADVNGDNEYNISDVVAIINAIAKNSK